MLHFNLENPIKILYFGEFISPDRGWKHLTRTLYEYELMVVTDGVLYIADETEEYAVHAGDYLIMSPTRFQHGSRVCKCRFYWLHFQCPALPASFSLPPLGKYRSAEEIRRLAEKLFEAERNRPRGVHSQYLATELLLELGSAEAQNGEAGEPLSARLALCARVKDFIDWHRFSPLKVSEIAKELGYHEKYLSAVFHSCEGLPLKQYLENKRLEEAKRLLADTAYTVSEVAYYLNFLSPHNFCRFFKEKSGMTPLAYRKSVPS